MLLLFTPSQIPSYIFSAVLVLSNLSISRNIRGFVAAVAELCGGGWGAYGSGVHRGAQ